MRVKNGGKRGVVGVLVVVALIGGGWLFFGHNSEPSYEGKSVSYWFKEFYSPQYDTGLDSNSHRDAINALHAMGSNALPYLVQVVFSTNEDSPARMKLNRLLDKLPDSWNLRGLITKNEIRQRAVEAIHEIGPPVTDILPLIQAQLNQTNTFQHLAAIFILTCVSNEAELAIPYCTKALRDPDLEIQGLVFDWLAGIGPKASLALPDLMEVFQNAKPGDRIRRRVLYVLEGIGSNAAPAVPQLKEAFDKETDWRARGSLAFCLYKIDPRQAYAIDYLVGLLTNDATPRQISFGASRLDDIGPNARFAIPALLNALKTTNCDYGACGVIVDALKHLGASYDQVMPILKLKADSDSKELREFALGRIRDSDSSGHEVNLVLMGLVRKRSKNESWAIYQLGYMGSKAEEAIPMLREESNGTNAEVAAAANLALRWIEKGSVVK